MTGGRAMSANPKLVVRELLGRCGSCYAEEAGIRLADRPGPLYQLLVLATLASARISAGIAVAAARELFAAGYRSPKAMSEASWQGWFSELRYQMTWARALFRFVWPTECAATALLFVHVGQSGQPRPDPVRRTPAPVSTISASAPRATSETVA